MDLNWQKTFKCLICWEIPSNPVKTNCCSVLICEQCIQHIAIYRSRRQKWTNYYNTSCPQCRKPFEAREDTLAKKLIKSFSLDIKDNDDQLNDTFQLGKRKNQYNLNQETQKLCRSRQDLKNVKNQLRLLKKISIETEKELKTTQEELFKTQKKMKKYKKQLFQFQDDELITIQSIFSFLPQSTNCQKTLINSKRSKTRNQTMLKKLCLVN